ncbi:hypothetical protein Hanom_Chr15g01385211 [Helianthus anomalus]
MLGVCYRITNNIFQKYLQDATCLLVDKPADSLNAATASQTPNRRLRDTLDVITEDFPECVWLYSGGLVYSVGGMGCEPLDWWVGGV